MIPTAEELRRFSAAKEFIKDEKMAHWIVKLVIGFTELALENFGDFGNFAVISCTGSAENWSEENRTGVVNYLMSLGFTVEQTFDSNNDFGSEFGVIKASW